MNCLHIIPPPSNQSHSNKPQATPRHPPDTFQTSQIVAHFDQSILRQLGEKELLLRMILIGHTHTVFRVTQTTPRHLSDTFRTPYKHSEAHGTPMMGEKKPAD